MNRKWRMRRNMESEGKSAQLLTHPREVSSHTENRKWRMHIYTEKQEAVYPQIPVSAHSENRRWRMRRNM